MTQLILERTDSISHILGQSLIQVDGDQAVAETFFLALMRLPGQDGPPRLNQLAGRFIDRVERVGGKWKIRHRTCVRDSSISLQIVEDDYATFGFVDGRRDRSDPGAALLGIAHRG